MSLCRESCVCRTVGLRRFRGVGRRSHRWDESQRADPGWPYRSAERRSGAVVRGDTPNVVNITSLSQQMFARTPAGAVVARGARLGCRPRPLHPRNNP